MEVHASILCSIRENEDLPDRKHEKLVQEVHHSKEMCQHFNAKKRISNIHEVQFEISNCFLVLCIRTAKKKGIGETMVGKN